MMLRFEDYIYTIGPNEEIINSKHITRVRITRKRIKLYLFGHLLNYIVVSKTKHNMLELRKIGVWE